VSSKILLAAEDLWLVRLVVLLCAAKGPVSEESIVAEFEGIGGVTAPRVRRLLGSLVGEKLLRQMKGSGAVFGATRRGRRVGLEVAARLSPLLQPRNDGLAG